MPNQPKPTIEWFPTKEEWDKRILGDKSTNWNPPIRPSPQPTPTPPNYPTTTVTTNTQELIIIGLVIVLIVLILKN